MDSGEENLFEEELVRRLKDHLKELWRAPTPSSFRITATDSPRRWVPASFFGASIVCHRLPVRHGVLPWSDHGHAQRRGVRSGPSEKPWRTIWPCSNPKARRCGPGRHEGPARHAGRQGHEPLRAGASDLHVPVVGSDQVVDVTGAGAQSSPAMSLSLCAGATLPRGHGHRQRGRGNRRVETRNGDNDSRRSGTPFRNGGGEGMKSEFGIRNSEFGIRNSEFGIRN